jgi:hypothetical protein
MSVPSYNRLNMVTQFYLVDEEVKRSMEWLIKRLIKVGAKVAYHGRRRYAHVASAFPLARDYRAVFGLRARWKEMVDGVMEGEVRSERG